jgi:hypothetical protein
MNIIHSLVSEWVSRLSGNLRTQGWGTLAEIHASLLCASTQAGVDWKGTWVRQVSSSPGSQFDAIDTMPGAVAGRLAGSPAGSPLGAVGKKAGAGMSPLQAAHSEPCILHPAPCTLHPAPCTLHPEP